MERDLKEIEVQIIHLCKMYPVKDIENCFIENIKALKGEICEIANNLEPDGIADASWSLLNLNKDIKLLVKLSYCIEFMHLIRVILSIKD